MTAEQAILLKKELKNWQKIYESKKNVVLVLAEQLLRYNGKEIPRKQKNAIVENLAIERDAQYRIKIIKERLGVR